jgi:hypothetical protein
LLIPMYDHLHLSVYCLLVLKQQLELNDTSCERVVIVIAVATIDFFYSLSHNLKNLEIC